MRASSQSSTGLTGNHIPFILDSERGEYGTLRAHISRANPIWRELSTTEPSIIMFQGPQSYITPSWYPTKQDEGKVVPTWDYVAVHAHGVAAVIHDKDWMLQLVSDLTKQNESARNEPWSVSDAPSEFIDGLLKAVVGIEIPISKIVGRWKLSQDEAMPDRVATAKELLAQGDANSRDLSKLVAARIHDTSD